MLCRSQMFTQGSCFLPSFKLCCRGSFAFSQTKTISTQMFRNYTPFNTRINSIRLNSTTQISEEDIDKSRLWLQTFEGHQIPRNIFKIGYSRSSGPGGQKVNKTSSKATISLEAHEWLNPQFCYWIPNAIRGQLSSKKIRYETKTGGILIQCDSSRNRDSNTDECFRRLLQEIKDNTFFPTEPSEEDKLRWEEIKADKKEKRLFNKKKQSDKKKSRSKNFDF